MTRRELEIADHLWDCLSRIAEDNGTEPQVVLNQAIYDLARRFNFLAPAPKNRQPMHQGAAPAAAAPPTPAPPAPAPQAPAKKA
ncbi:hypothetical protein L6R52_36550, partial [Myxococcota bacterium]|nr:hypothetical protein [Myxococcota bacterium]